MGLQSTDQPTYTVQAGDQFNPYTGQSLNGATVGTVLYNPKTAAPVYSPPTSYQAPVASPYVAPAPALTTSGQTSLYSGGANYTGPSINDFLKTAGQAYDFSSRQKLATQYGIQNYTGTATQNTQLLNILKGFATGNVSNTGIPNTMGSPGTLPNPNQPLQISNNGMLDLNKILGANLPNSTASSDIAGLLSLYGANTESTKQYDALSSQFTDLMKSLGGEGADLKSELDKEGVPQAYAQMKELNMQAAQLKGQLDKFDAETLSGKSSIEDQTIPTGLILGQQGQYQKQRDLTRIGKAAELSATIALSQAYQGNAELGLKLAQQAVDMKYQPILNEIDVLKAQLGFAQDKMSREDAARSKIISSLLELKVNDINQKKTTQSQIQTLAIQAATNGAPLSIITKMRGAPDAVTASQIGAQWIKGNLEKVGTTGGTGTGVKTVFTQTQINKGAANAGIPLSTFKTYSSDDQNFFVNGFSEFLAALKAIDSGSTDAKTVITGIQNDSVLSQTTKDVLIKQVNQKYPSSSTSTGTSWWDKIKSFFTGS